MASRPTLLVPITTPFDDRDRVDGEALAANIEQLLALGVDGIVVAGSTGEAALLEPDEFVHLVETARALVPKTHILAAGSGRESTKQTLAATMAAGRAGADIVLVRPPSYYGAGLDEDDLIRHFRSVADGTEIPVLLYNIPKYTPLVLPVRVIEVMAAHEMVTGLKDSGGDMARFAEFRKAGPDLSLYVGSLAHVEPAVALGANGGILAAACFLPREVRQLLDLAAQGEEAHSRALADRLRAVAKAVVAEAGVPGIKYAMDRVGFRGGPPRGPLTPLGPGRQRLVDIALEGAGVALTVKS